MVSVAGQWPAGTTAEKCWKDIMCPSKVIGRRSSRRADEHQQSIPALALREKKKEHRRLRLPKKYEAPLAPALAGANGMNATEAKQQAVQSQAVIRLENAKMRLQQKPTRKK